MKTKLLIIIVIIAITSISVMSVYVTTNQEQITKQKLQIEKPKDSPEKIAVDIRAHALFAEEANIRQEITALITKYNIQGTESFTTAESKRLSQLNAELKDIQKNIVQLNIDSRALITITESEKSELYKAVVTIRESDIPFTGVSDDQNNKAVVVYFKNKELAEKYAADIEKIIHVPFYVDVGGYVTADTCASFDETCPLSDNHDESKKLWKSTSDWNAMKLVRNNDDLYCNSANDELSDKCYSLDEIVFGDGNKMKETGWKLYPGGAGWTLPENSTLSPIYKNVGFGVPPLDFTAMLDDKTFVNKCESNGGIWNYTYHDCEGLWNVCQDVDGIIIEEDITPSCTDTGVIDDDPLTIKVCRDAGIIRVSCVFEYEN